MSRTSKSQPVMMVNAVAAPEGAVQPRIWPSGHTNDADRLDALNGLDMQAESPLATFERITRLAAQLLGVANVFVSFMEEKKHWFKSRMGIEVIPPSDPLIFQLHMASGHAALVVSDTQADSRLAGLRTVIGPPFARAYAGVPLCTRSGSVIGVLSAIDTRPRSFTEPDTQVLRDFAKLMEQTLHAREMSTATAGVRYIAVEHEKLFRDTFEQAAVGMAHATLNGKLCRVNKRLTEMLGYSAAELCSVSLKDLTHPDDLPLAVKNFKAMVVGALDDYKLDKRIVCKDGSYLWTTVSVSLKRSASGRSDNIIAVIEDIAEKKRLETGLYEIRDSLRLQVARQTARLKDRNAALRTQVARALASEREVKEAGRQFFAIADNIPALIGYWNRDMRCEFANAMHRDWFTREPESLIGVHMRDLLGADSFAAIEPYARKALAGKPQRFESSLVSPDGSELIREIRYIPDRRGGRTIRGFFVLETDSTQSRGARRLLEDANVRLASESATDYLTGLPNRRAFTQRCESAVQDFLHKGRRYSLMMLDLDDFKAINDRFGHQAGDEVLRSLGRVLTRELRDSCDIASRLGGEEFGILCFGRVNKVELLSIGERLRRQIENESIRVGANKVRLTASIGIASCCRSDANCKDIYARADAALYAAKSKGKNRVVFDRGRA